MLINLLFSQLLESNFGEFSFTDENVEVKLEVKHLQGEYFMWLRVVCKDKFTYGCNNLKVEGTSEERIVKNQIVEISNQLLIVGYTKSATDILKAIS